MSTAFILLLISSFLSSSGIENDNRILFYLGLATILISVLLFVWVLISILYEGKSDYKNHPDFNIYYDNKLKRNYWILGYFGGGAIPIAEAEKLAREYAKDNDVSYNSVVIDEIFKSRRFKGFKYMYSLTEQNPDADAEVLEDVFNFLTD